ncbi:carbohydrate-binding family 9-like protein [Flavobacterium sp. ALJ2]|uniref:carbohydrate-binding family 9-like protein n=1 Tax=Flavobacterium sp. ALJ2 TaxID=2786960 RepID=UPI00189F9033|nr:carbohydrate-binding family 9-like protein [Flavobacterium sp. ALJ2]MBF7091713.1 carbohydrate-binding family 9-like protein [Flavobacterium sp. ALJ2]
MRLSRLFYCVVFSISFFSYSQTLPIHKIANTLIIDGDFSDWKTPFLGPFVMHDSGLKATQETYVSLSWDADNVYFAYKCIDSEIIGSAKKQDAPIFNTDDLVELFIDPDGDSKYYLEIGVNAFSSNYDMIINCISPLCGGWNMDMELDILGMNTTSKFTANGYNVEIKIPFSSLNAIKNAGFTTPIGGTKWKGNLFRIDYGNTTEYLALQSYKSLQFGFHQPQEFAVFEFVE